MYTPHKGEKTTTESTRYSCPYLETIVNEIGDISIQSFFCFFCFFVAIEELNNSTIEEADIKKTLIFQQQKSTHFLGNKNVWPDMVGHALYWL